MLSTMRALVKRLYPITRRAYTIKLRRDLWQQLALEMYMTNPYSFMHEVGNDRWALRLYNVKIVPRD